MSITELLSELFEYIINVEDLYMIDQMPEKAEMRSMKKVVFFGSIGLAKRILVEIILKQDI